MLAGDCWWALEDTKSSREKWPRRIRSEHACIHWLPKMHAIEFLLLKLAPLHQQAVSAQDVATLRQSVAPITVDMQKGNDMLNFELPECGVCAPFSIWPLTRSGDGDAEALVAGLLTALLASSGSPFGWLQRIYFVDHFFNLLQASVGNFVIPIMYNIIASYIMVIMIVIVK